MGTLGPHTVFSQLPSAAPSYFPESHWQSETSSLSKVILVLGKGRSCRAPSLCCRGAESPGGFDVLLKKLCIRFNVWASALSWWSCRSPVAHSYGFWIIWIVSTEECSSLMQNLMQICCSPLVILNATATQYIHSLNGICCPHWLVQVKSLFTQVCSSPLSLAARLHWCCTNRSCYINNARIFPDRPCIIIAHLLNSYHVLGTLSALHTY